MILYWGIFFFQAESPASGTPRNTGSNPERTRSPFFQAESPASGTPRNTSYTERGVSETEDSAKN